MERENTNNIKADNRFVGLKDNQQKELQDIVEILAKFCKTPIALITVLDNDALFSKFRVGTDVAHAALKDSFCQYILDQGNMLIVPDTVLDIRFSDFPLVTGDTGIRFYAGAPLTTYDGVVMGSLCVLDVKPRKLTKSQKSLLVTLAKRVVQIVEFEYMVLVLKKQLTEAKEAEIKIQSYFNSPGACHLMLGKHLQILAFNKNMAEFAKKARGITIAIGDKIGKVSYDGHIVTFIKNFKKAITGAAVNYEKKYRCLNGESVWMQVNFEPAYNPSGEIIGVSYNAIDITAQKLKEQEIQAKTASLDEIALIQSHGLRRPVASIMGIMELFKMSGYRANKEYFMMMEKATTELDQTIRKIVDYTS